MTAPMHNRQTNVCVFPQNNERMSTTTTTSGGSSGTTTVENCQEMTEQEVLRNRAELLREKYFEVIGRDMPMAVLRQLLLSLLAGTPWQYYDYALDETALAPAPSWRYAMAIVNRLDAQAVPIDQIREPRPKKRGKILEHQDYTQREYTHSDDPMDRMMAEFLSGRR